MHCFNFQALIFQDVLCTARQGFTATTGNLMRTPPRTASPLALAGANVLQRPGPRLSWPSLASTAGTTRATMASLQMGVGASSLSVREYSSTWFYIKMKKVQQISFVFGHETMAWIWCSYFLSRKSARILSNKKIINFRLTHQFMSHKS